MGFNQARNSAQQIATRLSQREVPLRRCVYMLSWC
jgi:hypothetical protein